MFLFDLNIHNVKVFNVLFMYYKRYVVIQTIKALEMYATPVAFWVVKQKIEC